MKKLIVSLGLTLTLSFGATLDEGEEAYKKGDYKTALIIFEDLASKNNVNAQNNLGVMYDNGYGVKQDYQKAKVKIEIKTLEAEIKNYDKFKDGLLQKKDKLKKLQHLNVL